MTKVVPESANVSSIYLAGGDGGPLPAARPGQYLTLRVTGAGPAPVLAMLHELAATRGGRDVWWIHGARGPREHPLAAEAHALLARMPHAREHVFYSGPPDPLEPPADGEVLICCARPRADIVLDM